MNSDQPSWPLAKRVVVIGCVVFAVTLAVSLALDYAEADGTVPVAWLVLLSGMTIVLTAAMRAVLRLARGQPGLWWDAVLAGGVLLVLLVWFVRMPTTRLEWEEIRRGWEQRRRELDGIRRTLDERRRRI
jgi:hypothetical protein